MEQINFLKEQLIITRTEISNLRKQLVSLKHEYKKDVSQIKMLLMNPCESKSDDEPNPQTVVVNPRADGITYKPIGFIETMFQNKRAVPRQPNIVNNKGCLVIDMSVFNNPEHALLGLDQFSHLWLIFHMHEVEMRRTPIAIVSPPRLHGERVGVFSTRSPHRPCPIGLSLVKIDSIEGNRIKFDGVDMVNGTPVLDIKPYIPRYDTPRRPHVDGVPVLELLNIDGSPTNQRISAQDSLESPAVGHQISFNQQQIPASPSFRRGVGEANSETPQSPRYELERGDPDGQERYTPPHITFNQDAVDNEVRVPEWVGNTARYRVQFTDETLARLLHLIGDRAESFKTTLESLLAEDPRSDYVRRRYPNHLYSCLLQDLSISCIFDESQSICRIVSIRNAEEMHNN